MEKWMGIEPYRMGVLTDLASKVTRQMLSGAWHLTYEEMGIVLGMIRYGIEESQRVNRELQEAGVVCAAGRTERRRENVPENRGAKEAHEEQPEKAAAENRADGIGDGGLLPDML